ncbi:multicopper oxidase domain-containing protein [Paenibacillus rhizosphaerae]|uniref:multicopper oxidase domain-containing protein n=1 Tax=Paenibacillus rhizosphaerae TaxID=297318 RepID=UPI0028B1AF15|nr:multicopper oxidase domain-containing protein [Paenibacillus rhizosphaerae]
MADNPGLWMMHCHNLMHASMGMSMMFNYEGVSTHYRVGQNREIYRICNENAL